MFFLPFFFPGEVEFETGDSKSKLSYEPITIRAKKCGQTSRNELKLLPLIGRDMDMHE